jgi:hypothetical protein
MPTRVKSSCIVCGLVVRVPGCRTEMYCVSCEVRTEFMYVTLKKVDLLCDLVVRAPGYRSRGLGSIPGATRFLWEIVGLELGPLSFVSTNEELLERKSSDSGLESREYGRKNPSRWPRDTLYLQTLALTSPTSYGHSVGIVRSRTQAIEFSLFKMFLFVLCRRRFRTTAIMLRQLMLLLLGAAMVMSQRRLALPDPRSCANSK